ncbi:MAG TPA: ThiF family adenylyltransferase [Gemmata sp.]|jgi:molybdopterin/thiamine biosynthesis adenylyltransferase|nr:ThiF family adenylyltransferase [Gemmata sp.]
MHIFQVGVGSGGMVVLDLLARDGGLKRVTIIDPDLFLPHNVHRHVFPMSEVGRLKVELAAEWLRERRPELGVACIAADLTDSSKQSEFNGIAAECDLGVCAVDNEPAKYAFDSLMRTHGKPWTLGEVLSGGIGGWVHRFFPDGPCYGCVASHLQRTVVEEPAVPMPNYANPGGAVAEATVPASKASIEAIASLHAVITLEIISSPGSSGDNQRADSGKWNTSTPGETFTSLLFTLKRVPGVFEEAFRTYRFVVPRAQDCLVCSTKPLLKLPETGENLDVALDQALDRLAPQ